MFNFFYKNNLVSPMFGARNQRERTPAESPRCHEVKRDGRGCDFRGTFKQTSTALKNICRASFLFPRFCSHIFNRILYNEANVPSVSKGSPETFRIGGLSASSGAFFFKIYSHMNDLPD